MRSKHPGIGMTSQRTRDRLVKRLRNEGVKNEAVLRVISNTPRHIFVDEALATRAYEDTALPIGQGQTISQPYVVARMTESLLGTDKLGKVLEIGTGCGYQTAILAQLVDRVYSIERIEPLIRQARRRFQELKLRNIRIRHGDGYQGWSEQGPFDGIIVTAAPEETPITLLEQLKVGGRMVIPVGGQGMQRLFVITRTDDGYEEQALEYVSFVPLLEGTA